MKYLNNTLATTDTVTFCKEIALVEHVIKHITVNRVTRTRAWITAPLHQLIHLKMLSKLWAPFVEGREESVDSVFLQLDTHDMTCWFITSANIPFQRT